MLTLLAALLPVLALADEYDALYEGLPIQLAQPALPDIPENTVFLPDFGAVGDGTTNNTQAFAEAVKALKKAGGGHLVVPAGIYLTGPIELVDRMDLHLERNALILFSPDKRDFLKKGKVVPGILAKGKKDVSITGEGILDGNAIAVFTAIGMCWSGFLSTHTAMLDSLGYRKVISKAIGAHAVTGLCAGIIAHFAFLAVSLL